jgi:hypothetical protein
MSINVSLERKWRGGYVVVDILVEDHNILERIPEEARSNLLGEGPVEGILCMLLAVVAEEDSTPAGEVVEDSLLCPLWIDFC